MMNHRHLMQNEKAILREMADSVGVVEMIRAIGQIVAHDHPDLYKGTECRSLLMKVAGVIDQEKPPAPSVADTQPGNEVAEVEPESERPLPFGTDRDPVRAVKSRVDQFKHIQGRLSKYGAEDTEPDHKWQRILYRAATGKPVEIPADGRGWSLYSSTPDSNSVGHKLTVAAADAVREIQAARENATAPQFREIVAFLKDHCDRLSWNPEG